MESFNDKVLAFQKSGKGLDELVSELAPTVYQFPRRRMRLDEDACGDFYLYFQPRLVRMLGRFQEQGRSFDTYLTACLNWQLRNFARERRCDDRTWDASLRLETAGGASQDETAPGAGQARAASGEPAHPPDRRPADPSNRCALPGLAGVIRSDTDRRSFLFLVLKCPSLVEDGKADILAATAGVSTQRLRDLAAELAEKRAPREARLQEFIARRNRAFCLARLLEGELRGETDETRRHALELRLSKARRRMRAAMEHMSRVGIAPTNREIAEALGIPKGTVDSGLFFLKKKLAAALDPDSQRTA